MIECYTTVTPEVYDEWWRIVKRSAFACFIIGIVGLLVCLGTIVFYDNAEEHYTVLTVFAFVSLLFIVCGRTVLLARRKAEKKLYDGITYMYIFEKEYVDVQFFKGGGHQHIRYDSLKRVGESQNYIYLYTTFNNAIIVSKAELGEENKKTVLNYIAEAKAQNK